MLSQKDIANIRKDFPILKDVVFLDNAASTQKPLTVIESMNDFYKNHYANIHRGLYNLSEFATELYEDARKTVADFFNVKPDEVIFTKNATESLNLLADSLVRYFIERKGSVNVLISLLEHHSNIVPWFIVKERYKNVNITFVNIKNFRIDKDDFKKKLKDADVVSLTGLSNVTGYLTDFELFALAKKNKAITICDGAQLVPHHKVDLKNIDFVAFSGHKMLGPTGIGVLIGKKELLDEIPSFLGGGDMIKEVNTNHFLPNDVPYKFEAGTMPFVEAFGLKKAIEYIRQIGMDNIMEYEKRLTQYAIEKMKGIKNIEIYGIDLNSKTGIISFNHKRFHPHDVAYFLNQKKIAVRAGHHCAMPLHKSLGINGSVRISLYFYNTFGDIDKLIDALDWINTL